MEREKGEESLLGRVGERVRDCVRERKREKLYEPPKEGEIDEIESEIEAKL